jgi:type I restriction-modification system DNA methylase subunit
LPEGENIGKAINDAMKAVEAENDELKGVLPKTYNKLENATLISLLKTFSQVPMDAEGDTRSSSPTLEESSTCTATLKSGVGIHILETAANVHIEAVHLT